MVAFFSHSLHQYSQSICRLCILAWFDRVSSIQLLGITHILLHLETGVLCVDLRLLRLCPVADVCKRGDVTVQPSHVISLGSAVNISCSLKPRQGCLQVSSLNKLILYRFHRRIHFQRGHSLSSQVTGLPLGTTLFVCKLACSSKEEIRICGAEISVGGEHSILSSYKLVAFGYLACMKQKSK